VPDQTLEELLENWKEERISAKEAIDQILRYVQLLMEQLRTLKLAALCSGRRKWWPRSSWITTGGAAALH
jgi:hypothetical protein